MSTLQQAMSKAGLILPVRASAFKRVLNPLPVPTICPYCDGDVHAVNNSAIYYGQSYGRWPYAYLCEDCRAYVGMHPETNIPLGTLADSILREARKVSKSLFQTKLMEPPSNMTRSEAYTYLAGRMGITAGNCHFAWFDVKQCEQVIALLK